MVALVDQCLVPSLSCSCAAVLIMPACMASVMVPVVSSPDSPCCRDRVSMLPFLLQAMCEMHAWGSLHGLMEPVHPFPCWSRMGRLMPVRIGRKTL